MLCYMGYITSKLFFGFSLRRIQFVQLVFSVSFNYFENKVQFGNITDYKIEHVLVVQSSGPCF